MIKCVENAKMPKKQNKQKPYFLVNLEKSKGHKKINFMFIFLSMSNLKMKNFKYHYNSINNKIVINLTICVQDLYTRN